MKRILIIIVVFGAVLRIAWLGTIPSGFFRDEAAISYNAYSIWQTGMDEFGVRFPLVFRSFEVFFLPLYIYLSAPIVGLLGLSVFSSRFLSAISGTFAIYFAYGVAKQIWNEKVGLWGAFILAICPWHIFYSRGTFEGNLGLTLFTAGFYFWLVFTKGYKIKYLLLSGVSFALSMYSYQAERVVVPIFVISALLLSFNNLWKIKTKLIIPAVLLFMILTPLLSLSFKAGGYHRALGVSIFSQEATPPGWINAVDPGILVNNSVYLRTKQILALYLSYFSPRNLFTFGDANLQRSVENFSVFYGYMLIGLLVGVWNLVKKIDHKKKLLIAWMVFAPIPAALTGDPFHTYRSLLLYMPLSILIGYGFYRLFEIPKAKKIFYKLLFAGTSFAALMMFLFNYAFVNQVKRAHDWDWGYSQIVNFVNSLPQETKVVVDDPWTTAYIQFLFFGKTNPRIYQEAVSSLGNPYSYYYTNSDKIRPVGYQNFEFRKVDWPSERGNGGVVFVMWQSQLPESEFKTDPRVKLLKEIYYPDGSVAYRIVQIVKQ